MASQEEFERLSEMLLSQMLAAVGEKSGCLPEREVAGFLAMKGRCYAQALMVVGRATNGWGEGRLPSALISPATVSATARRISEGGTSGECPMAWVMKSWGSERGCKYNTKRSAFWRAIRAVVGRLGIADVNQESWASHVAWSNLYKVSPEAGGNPGSSLCAIQLDKCIELLKLELAAYAPRRLLLLTGLNWAEPFRKEMMPALSTASVRSHVEASGLVRHDAGETKVVVAVHPQGKPLNAWVDAVMEGFGALQQA